ncbi:hypothetical protein K470DRAFT_207937, partial [Piedraia hortae CBS 480.64]
NAAHYGSETRLHMLVAILASKLILNHACFNGNKRTALVSANMFLRLNVYRFK